MLTEALRQNKARAQPRALTQESTGAHAWAETGGEGHPNVPLVSVWEMGSVG